MSTRASLTLFHENSTSMDFSAQSTTPSGLDCLVRFSMLYNLPHLFSTPHAKSVFYFGDVFLIHFHLSALPTQGDQNYQ